MRNGIYYPPPNKFEGGKATLIFTKLYFKGARIQSKPKVFYVSLNR